MLLFANLSQRMPQLAQASAAPRLTVRLGQSNHPAGLQSVEARPGRTPFVRFFTVPLPDVIVFSSCVMHNATANLNNTCSAWVQTVDKPAAVCLAWADMSPAEDYAEDASLMVLILVCHAGGQLPA